MERRASCGHASRSCLYSRCLWTHSPLTTWRSWSSTVQHWSSSSWSRIEWCFLMQCFLCEWTREHSSTSESASLSPTVPYGQLEQFTELHVSPKISAGTKDRFGAPFGTSLLNQNQPIHRQLNFDLSPSSRSSLESIQETGLPVEQCPNAAGLQCPQQWCGIAILKNMVRYMLTWNYDPVRESPPPISNISSLLSDSVFRVCRAPPVSSGPLSASLGVDIILTWGQQMGV
ncbi:uncharacterized protein ACWYII_022083 [Salvelinus alpinus]